MKNIFILICLLVLPILISAQSGSTKIDGALDELMSAHPNDYHGVLIFLKDQVDTRALLIKYENEKTPLAQRSNEVITSLQQKVATTQPSVLALLDQTEGVEKGSVATLWVVNLIYVRANAHAIAQIATWEEVQTISFNTTLQNEAISNPQFAPSSPNGSETGLRVIKAPFMWAKGYTGYGRKGLVIDTGQDGDHPALLANFWGDQVLKEQAWHSNKWPEDCANHGSHVTGTMVGLDRKTNDTIGVAYNAHWMGAPMFSLVDTSATLFPNPNDGTFAVRFGAAYAPQSGDVQVFDMLGRAVLTQRNAVQQATVQVNASTLANGVYFVQITENGELRWMGRFVKK